MSYSRDYDRAVRYGAREAADIQYKGSNSDSAGTLAHAAASGDNTAMLALADMMQDHDHPIVPYLQRAANGEGEAKDDATAHSQDVLGILHPVKTEPVGADHMFAPGHFPLLNTNGHVSVHYYHLPDEHHYFHLKVGGFDKDGEDPLRSFLLPVKPEEVHAYADKLKEMEAAKGYGKHSQYMKEAVDSGVADNPGFDYHHSRALGQEPQ